MAYDLFNQALSKLSRNSFLQKEFDKSVDKSKYEAFFTKYDIPDTIIDFLVTYNYGEIIKFNKVTYYADLDVILNENTDEYTQKVISNGYLIVGHGLNGDFIVIDLQKNTVGFVFHDEVAESEDDQVTESYIPLDITVGEFYLNSMVLENYPYDGFMAEEYTLR